MTLIQPITNEAEKTAAAHRFCEAFFAGKRPAFVMGRNGFAENILSSDLCVDAVIDDFTTDTSFQGRPIIRTVDLPADALVLIGSGVRPLTARKRLRDQNVECLDYFAFHRHSGLSLPDVTFNVGFAEEFHANEAEYQWVYDNLADEQSREVFLKVINFRLSYDVDFMEGFVYDEDNQYFEDFLNLKAAGESFVDAGGFDGNSSLMFMRRCPGYGTVHLFEPEPQNFANCKAALSSSERVSCYNLGLSDVAETLSFASSGPASKITDGGSMTIRVDRLDDVVKDPYTFMKMDIEGAELAALSGAEDSIRAYHPQMALCVYHVAGDFWRIPKKVLSIREDYKIRLRHHSEGVIESVMYFSHA